ncbi:VWA domain-containing protein [Pararhodospirillum photometricum]|nr:VWA domain-containing protein [Pararhodospirillum photometricum]
MKPGARLNLIATLRTAAPWQRVRRQSLEAAAAAAGRTLPPVLVRAEDFRFTRYRKRTPTATIFVVDASGSAAMHRLAEAKGAVELLLADCYVRRDQVALVSFRGKGAELLLPPTRSLVRAKRGLAGLPGGGGTPLAAGIELAKMVAESVAHHGETPVLVFLTDGRANVCRNGLGGRAQAHEEALKEARQVRAAGFTALMIDMAPRPDEKARQVALEMDARYLPLPYADAGTISVAARSVAGDSGGGPPRRAGSGRS